MKVDSEQRRDPARDDAVFVARLQAAWRPPALDDVGRRAFDARLHARLAEGDRRRRPLAPALGFALAALLTLVWVGLPTAPVEEMGRGATPIPRQPGIAREGASAPGASAVSRARWEQRLFYADPVDPADPEVEVEGALPAEYAAIGSLLLDG